MQREMERFMNEALHYGTRSCFAGDPCWSPPADVFETEEGFLVKFEVAGLDLGRLEVVFEDGRLTLSGTRSDAHEEARVVCHQMEIPYGCFRRTLAISRDVDGDAVTAHYADGFLTIRLPRSDPSGPRKVRIDPE
jgi:HSP20 family protein